MKLKSKLKILIALVLLTPSFAFADTWFPTGSPTVLTPVVSTWGLRLPSLLNKACIGTDVSGNFKTGTCSGGGAAAGTWSSTTSSVPAWLLNYSNNTTDIIVIGGNSTSTAKFIFDPNSQIGYFSGNVGIGTKSPTYPLDVVGSGHFTGLVDASRFVATSSTASSFPYASTTAISATNAYVTKLGNLTTNGFVKTGSSDGTLSVDTNTYLTGNQTITLTGDVTGSGATAITTTYNGTVPINKGGTNRTTIGASSTVAVSDGTNYQFYKLAPANFTTANVSQWTNDAGYLTSIPFSYPFPLVVGGTNGTTSIQRFDGGIISNASSSFSGQTYFNDQVNVANNTSLLFAGGSPCSSTTGIKTGTDGTFLFDAGCSIKFKGGTGLTQGFTDGSFNYVWQNNLNGDTTQSGVLTVSGAGTSTFTGFIAATAASTTATSTMAGINLPYGGCFAVKGTCITGGSGGSGTVTNIATTWPVIGGPITNTGTLSFGGLSTSSPIAAGAAILYATGVNTIASVATSTLTPTAPLGGSFTQIGSGGSVTCSIASASQAGCISAASFSKHDSATTTFTSPLVYTGGTNAVTCPTCNVSNATVSSIATNNGLTGGTITTTGTIGLDITGLSTNGIVTWNGSILAATGTTGSLTVPRIIATSTASSTFAGGIDAARVCLTGTTTCLGGSSGSGTVTSVATNNGLTGGTITGAGTIGLDLTGISANNTALTWNGSKLTATGTNSFAADSFIATSTTKVSIINGKLGIGTSSPSNGSTLGVIGTSTFNGDIVMGNTTGGVGLVQDYSGYVGAGTSTPWVPFATQGRVAMNGLSTSGAAQTGYICYGVGGELVQDSSVCLVSALKFKKDVKDLGPALDEVMQIRPVSYYKKQPLDQNDSHEQVGVIADEVEKIDPRLVSYDINGDIHGFRYDEYTAILTKAIQELAVKVQGATRSAEENWQWLAIILLGGAVAYQGWQIKKLKR